MFKPVFVLFSCIVALTVTACADVNAGNTPEQQRSNAHKAQGELSREVNK